MLIGNLQVLGIVYKFKHSYFHSIFVPPCYEFGIQNPYGQVYDLYSPNSSADTLGSKKPFYWTESS
jgi:hypothetical protein